MIKVFWKVVRQRTFLSQGFFFVIYINYHGTASLGLFLTFIKVACMIKIGFYRLIVLELDNTN